MPFLDKLDLINILDFGTSKIFDPKKMEHQPIGTPYFIAPEVIAENYTSKCDIWSIGIMCNKPISLF